MTTILSEADNKWKCEFNVNILVGLFVVVLAINLLKGGGAFPSPIGIVCGSQNFWIANAIMLGWIILISIYCRAYLVKRFELKQKVGYKYIEGDIQWDDRSTIIYPGICCLAGFFAGMFGSKYCCKTTTVSGFSSSLSSSSSFQYIYTAFMIILCRSYSFCS